MDARAGFTLVELAYVVLLVGIMAAMALPRIDVGRARVDGGALEVASHLLLAQRVAVLRQHDVRVLVDSTARTLLIHEDTDNDGQQGTGEQVTRRQLGDGVAFGTVGGSGLMGASGAATFDDGPEGLPTLTFHRNGSASEEGIIHLTTAGPALPDNDRGVHVERATGLSRCWSRRTGAWLEGC